MSGSAPIVGPMVSSCCALTDDVKKLSVVVVFAKPIRLPFLKTEHAVQGEVSLTKTVKRAERVSHWVAGLLLGVSPFAFAPDARAQTNDASYTTCQN